MTRHLLSIQVAAPKGNDRYRYDGQPTYLTGPVTVAPDGQEGFLPGTYRIFYDAESAGEEYGFEFVVGDTGELKFGRPFKRDPGDENYAAPPGLQTVTEQDNETTLPVLTGGYLTWAFPEVESATHILVDGEVERNGQVVHQVARLPKKLLYPEAQTPAVVWAAGELYEQVAKPASQVLVWAARELYEQVAAAAPALPLAPTDVRVVRNPNTRNATLRWVDNARNETRYEVEESANKVDFSPLIALDPNVIVLPLSDLPMNTPRWYRVRAVNEVGPSEWVVSNRLILIDYSVTFFVYGQGNPPDVIRQLFAGGISITPGRGNIGAVVTLPGGSAPTAEDFDKVSLDVLFPDNVRHGWNYPDAEARGTPYWSDRRPDGTDLPTGLYGLVFTAYKYDQPMLVVPFAFSFSAPPAKPNAPSEFRAVRITGGVGFNWKDNANNESTFEIWIKQPSDGAYTYLKSVQANTTNTTSLLSPLADNTEFQIMAVNSAGASDWVSTKLEGTNLPVITLMQVSVVASGPGGKYTQVLRPTLSAPDAVQWQWVQANGNVIIDWTEYGVPAPWGSNDYVHYFETGIPPGTTLYLRARPKSNPTAVKGIYAASYGGTATYDFTTITPA